MKKISTYFLLFSLLIGCEDVIDVDLPENDSRLVVNGVIRVDESLAYVPIEITLTESSNFFTSNVPARVDSATLYYGTPNPNNKDELEGGGVCNLAESSPGSSLWIPDPNLPTDQRISVTNINEETVFKLVITTLDQRYEATTTYVKTVPFNSVEQGDQTLFSGDETEVVVSFTDTPDMDNYYILDFGFNEYVVTRDELYQGQNFVFSYFYDAELSLDEASSITISIFGADESFYNYMNQVTVQAGGDQGPFSTPAATVRGNILNTTTSNSTDPNIDQETANTFGLGYFAVVQEYKETIVIEKKDEN